jgi:hypothetical protein
MRKVAQASTAWNATLRTTCVATQIEGGHARNALPQLAAANVNCRVLSEDSVEYVQGTLQRVIADDQVSLTIAGEVSKGPASPMREDVLRAVSRLTDTLWPGVPTVPIMVMNQTTYQPTTLRGTPFPQPPPASMELEGGVYPARDFSPAHSIHRKDRFRMLISDKQHQANRKECAALLRSENPAGKEAIRFNALTYGLRTRASILPDENAADYSQLWDELEADWQPQTRTERLYLETMVTSQWLLKRVAESEQKIYAYIALRRKRSSKCWRT